MAWTLNVYDETGTTLESVFSDTSSIQAIDGGFQATVRGSGDCISLAFRGRNDLLQIRVRQIVHLFAGTAPIFWGVITRAPNLASPGAGPEDSSIVGDLEDFTAEGGRALISGCVSGPRYIGSSTDVADIFEDFLTRYGPSQLTGDVTQIATTSSVLTLFYKPNAQLDVVLDELVATVDGWVWGVNASGKVFLKELTGLSSFAATELVDFYFKPVSAEDIVTKVNLVVAGSPSGRVPEGESYYLNDPYYYNDSGNGELDARTVFDYVPSPIIHTYEDASHSTYGAEKTFALPPGVFPFLDGPAAEAVSGMGWTDVSSNWSNEANMYDGNNSTYASSATPTLLRWFYLASGTNPAAAQKIVGFRLVYTADFPDSAYAYAEPENKPHVTYYQNVIAPLVTGTPSAGYTSADDYALVMKRYYTVLSSYSVGDAFEGVGKIDSITPYPAEFEQSNLDDVVETAESCYTYIDLAVSVATGTVKLYHFYPLVLDTTLLDEVAKSNISLPSTLSGDVVLTGYSEPVPVVTVTGLFGTAVGSPPSTNMTEAVETIEYTMTPQDGLLTKFTLGNDDTSDAAKLLKRYVRDGITASNYALTVGSATRT